MPEITARLFSTNPHRVLRTEVMLRGKMWVQQWGTRRELVETYRYLKELYPEEKFSGEVYAREGMFGVREDKTLPRNTWLFETVSEDVPQSPPET